MFQHASSLGNNSRLDGGNQLACIRWGGSTEILPNGACLCGSAHKNSLMKNGSKKTTYRKKHLLRSIRKYRQVPAIKGTRQRNESGIHVKIKRNCQYRRKWETLLNG
uniref:60S ribosomal protein L34 n=1 Tax=Strongyloides papillosus TaxID=174720 RepID=A0A0N5C9K0_STREA